MSYFNWFYFRTKTFYNLLRWPQGCNRSWKFCMLRGWQLLVIEGSGADEIKAKTELISKKHVAELHKLGMVVNTSKSEVVIFSKKPIITDVIIGDTLVKTKTDMKVLGIIFDAQLKWEAHVKAVISKCNSKLSVLRKIRGKFKMDQFLKIITTQFFSHLYYCSTVWLSSETRWNLKKLINTAHYKALRITLQNKKRINRDRINKMTKRCTPKEWGLHTSASVAMKVIRDQQPKHLHQSIRSIHVEEHHWLVTSIIMRKERLESNLWKID